MYSNFDQIFEIIFFLQTLNDLKCKKEFHLYNVSHISVNQKFLNRTDGTIGIICTRET